MITFSLLIVVRLTVPMIVKLYVAVYKIMLSILVKPRLLLVMLVSENIEFNELNKLFKTETISHTITEHTTIN